MNSYEYYIHLAIMICMYIILAQGLNINFGLAGVFNLAHVAAYAIGAYTVGILSTDYQYGFWSCIALSIITSSFFSLLLGSIALRLKQDYFAIGTLAFSAVVSALLINWKSLTKGVLGIPGIPRPIINSYELNDNIYFLLLIGSFMIITQIIFYILFRSGFARALIAQSEFPEAAQALSRNTTLIKNFSFVLASASAGLAGAFFAYYLNYIDPSSFSLSEMIFVLTIIIVGRPGSFWGCILASIFLVLLPEPLRFIEISPGILGPMRQLIYAIILFAAVFINRRKLFPVQRKI
jgi:branched-chain amino acid transport system permease protein